MTNARDFSLDAELAQTSGWDEDDFSDPADTDETDDGWESGYAEDDGDGEDGDEYADDDPELTTGEQDLAERYALRRVAGLSTELEDISEVEYRQLRLERVVLVGVWTDGSVEDAENSMAELAALAETAGSEVLDAIYQRRDKPDPATFIGRGKVEGIAEIVRSTGAQPAAQPGGPDQGQGRRPHRADPRHLRPAREEQGGAGTGRAGPAQLHEAAPPWLGWQPLPPGRRARGRWRRHRRPRPG
jgi:GTP-binding protein HflX